ncbi:unnamed protein product [Prorocentrum cordatum]|uniref:Uncharacterized protein n=1 Tax=Prorocentrum cordatum TaxID=2364126 RepID=A0ABN9Y7W0_9DINO|nr:unnamed protein product [Polarella glacialis]
MPKARTFCGKVQSRSPSQRPHRPPSKAGGGAARSSGSARTEGPTPREQDMALREIAVLKPQLLASGQAGGAAADVAMGGGAEPGADAAAAKHKSKFAEVEKYTRTFEELLPADGTCGNDHIKQHIGLHKQERDRIRAEMQQARSLAARLQSISDSMDRAYICMDKGKKLAEEKREHARAAVAIAEEQEARIAKLEVELLELQQQRVDILRGAPPPPVLQGFKGGAAPAHRGRLH